MILQQHRKKYVDDLTDTGARYKTLGGTTR